MLAKTLKSFLAVAVVSTGAALAPTTSANAGNASFSLHIGGGHGGIHFGQPYKSEVHHRGGYRYYKDHRRHRGCHPRRALRKAWKMGVNRPHIARIGHKRIVVVGYNHGYKAKVVFKRHHPRCKVIKTRGLY